ncbi:MAG TPA: hypothetical protein VLE43_05905 [Candidatus Saccharimonadia bacterium]|nr:hypothetical protein [Candidatus Saccharimonadia bacterium]
MPLDFDPTEIAQSGDFTMQERETMHGEAQANVTFRVTTSGHRALGARGELSGIAKLDPEEARQHVEQARDRAMEEAMTRLGQIATEINQRLNTENDLTEDQRRRLQEQRDFILRKTTSGSRTIGQMDLPGLGNYSNDPIIVKAVTLHRQVMNQMGNDAIFQSLGVQTGEGRDTAMLTRAVGTSKVDQLLGTNIISEERFGVDEQGRTIGISVRVDGFGVIGKLPGNREYQLDIDYSRHEVQKGLYDLEVLDYITGQIDRHAGNIFIDPETGEVKGIDNDLCFPSLSREQMLSDLRDAGGKAVYNKPLFMHEDTARKIEELDPGQLRETLGALKYPGRGERGKLSPEEIEGAVTRLNEMKQHVRDLRGTGHVVTEFTKETYDEAVQHQKDSYAEQRADNMTVSGRSMDTVEDPMLVDMVHKTSYIGSILCEQRKTDLAQLENVGRVRLDPEEVRTETNSTGKSTRGEEHVEFARLEKERRTELRPTETAPLQEDLDRLNQRVARMQQRRDRLEHPNLWDRFRAIWHGGVEGAKRAFEGKRDEAIQDIAARKEIIESNIKITLDQESGARWNEAKQNVQNERLQRVQQENLGLKQGVDNNEIVLGEEIGGKFVFDPDKLQVVDRSPQKTGFILKEPSQIEIVIDEVSINGDDLSQEEPKPELQKQGSVRDLLKDSRKGDKDLKPQNEVEIGDDTVRSQVELKKGETETQKGPVVKF